MKGNDILLTFFRQQLQESSDFQHFPIYQYILPMSECSAAPSLPFNDEFDLRKDSQRQRSHDISNHLLFGINSFLRRKLKAKIVLPEILLHLSFQGIVCSLLFHIEGLNLTLIWWFMKDKLYPLFLKEPCSKAVNRILLFLFAEPQPVKMIQEGIDEGLELFPAKISLRYVENMLDRVD